MADWTTITDSQVDPDAPITSGLGYAWRDNPVAMGEKATTVPQNLRLGIWLIGTLTTTSGTTHTLSGLNLTEYLQLYIVVKDMSGTGAATVTIAGKGIITLAGSASVINGVALLAIRPTGNSFGLYGFGGTLGANAQTMDGFTVNSASTSITASISAGTFDAGSIEFYGVR